MCGLHIPTSSAGKLDAIFICTFYHDAHNDTMMSFSLQIRKKEMQEKPVTIGNDFVCKQLNQSINWCDLKGTETKQ